MVLIAVIGVALLLAAPVAAEQVAAGPPDVECDGPTSKGVNDFFSHIDYAMTYDKSDLTLCVVARNNGEKNGTFRYSMVVDDTPTAGSVSSKLAPGEEFRDNQTIVDNIDATRDNHSVVVSAHNGTFYFNFTRKINTMDEQGIPTPHFEDLRIQRSGTESGQPRIVLQVENEAERTYVPEGEVRTFESDSRYLDDTNDGQPGGQYSVRLSESNDEIIIGTARLYGGTFNPGTKFDRISFVSYPNGTYEIWEPEFEEIPTRREIEERTVYYENSSAKREFRGPDVDSISETASKVGAVLVVLGLVLGFWFWRRQGRL